MNDNMLRHANVYIWCIYTTCDDKITKILAERPVWMMNEEDQKKPDGFILPEQLLLLILLHKLGVRPL